MEIANKLYIMPLLLVSSFSHKGPPIISPIPAQTPNTLNWQQP